MEMSWMLSLESAAVVLEHGVVAVEDAFPMKSSAPASFAALRSLASASPKP